jgi:hypothetical protein
MGSCYSKIAFKKKDLNICRNIKDIELKNSCIIGTAEGKNDPTICQYMEIVIGISPNNDRKYFIDSCIFNVAITNKDPTICNTIQTEPFKDECYRDSK